MQREDSLQNPAIALGPLVVLAFWFGVLTDGATSMRSRFVFAATTILCYARIVALIISWLWRAYKRA